MYEDKAEDAAEADFHLGAPYVVLFEWIVVLCIYFIYYESLTRIFQVYLYKQSRLKQFQHK